MFILSKRGWAGAVLGLSCWNVIAVFACAMFLNHEPGSKMSDFTRDDSAVRAVSKKDGSSRWYWGGFGYDLKVLNGCQDISQNQLHGLLPIYFKGNGGPMNEFPDGDRLHGLLSARFKLIGFSAKYFLELPWFACLHVKAHGISV